MYRLVKNMLKKSHYSHSDFVRLLTKYNFDFRAMDLQLKSDHKVFIDQIINSTGPNTRQTRTKNKRISYVNNNY